VQTCPRCGEENADSARFCSACGAPLADTPTVRGEERKVVSVLFVDLVGFTAASETIDPEDVRARLRPYHARVKQEIERFGGTVEKFIGDAVMAVFGAPVAHEDDPERAVNAALRVIAAIDELNETQPDLELSVRAAVNTGEAVVTVGARPAEGEAMVAGDVVNTAARLQQHAPVNGVAVGEATYRATRDLFEYDPLDPVAAKGKAEPVPLWHAKAARRRFGVDVEPVSRTPLIGRDDDLALLQSTYARTLRESSTQLVTIVGEPGVGKTRLTAEFRRWADDQPEIAFWRQGRSLPYGEGITYWALGEIVKAQAGILESDSPDDARTKLAVAIREVTPDTTEQDWLSNSLAPLVGTADGTGASTPETSFNAWQRFLEGVAAQRPLVAVFEDLHWADGQLLAFVEHLVDWSTGVPLLVLCTARPELYERSPGWGGGKRNSNTISLSPLGPENTARLLGALMQRAVLPAETQTRLIEQAGGNPLYAEEFVRMLLDQDLLSAEGELRDGDIRVPDNVQALIAARLDTLAPERKALLHDAAVVGKVFWSGVVAAMGNVDESFVRTGLQELGRKELVRAVRESSVQDQAEYAFWHALVRDVAYSQIPRAQRIPKHVAAAEWIERMAGHRATDHAELLAYHYEQALDLARTTGSDDDVQPLIEPAARMFALAGDRALSLDLSRAYAYYVRAAELYPEGHVRRGDFLLKALQGRGGPLDEAERRARETLAIFRTAGDALREGAALIVLSSIVWVRGDTAQSNELEVEALEKLERYPPGEELLNAYARRAGSLSIAGRSQEALETIDRALQLAEQLQSDAILARMYQYRGIARTDLGDLEGVDDVRSGLELALEIGDISTAGIGYSNLASNLLPRSPAEALDAWNEGIDFATKRGITGNRFWQLAESTWALFDLGRWDEVAERATEVVEWADRGGLAYAGAIAAPQHALVLLHRGRPDEAAPLLERFIPVARDAGDPQVVVPALAAAALLAAARDDLPLALDLVRELESRTRTGAALYRPNYLSDVVAIAFAAGTPEVAAAFLETEYGAIGRAAHSVVAARARVAEETGELDDALLLYEDAARRWADRGAVLSHAEALHGAGRCLVALGRAQEATSPLREARELLAGLGAQPAVERVDDLLAQATSRTA
jgi:class 3 adenylate cyclase/tetratricopeptide (TPR) repeat protein